MQAWTGPEDTSSKPKAMCATRSKGEKRVSPRTTEDAVWVLLSAKVTGGLQGRRLCGLASEGLAQVNLHYHSAELMKKSPQKTIEPYANEVLKDVRFSINHVLTGIVGHQRQKLAQSRRSRASDAVLGGRVHHCRSWSSSAAAKPWRLICLVAGSSQVCAPAAGVPAPPHTTARPGTFHSLCGPSAKAPANAPHQDQQLPAQPRGTRGCFA